jgi:hypothetical protein
VTDAADQTLEGVKVDFAASGANSATSDDTTASDGTATFTYTGTNPGEDEIDANVDSDSSVADSAEEDWIGSPATLKLTPATGTDSTGGQHTVTATVKDAADQRLEGVKVDFEVSDANTASGDDTTAADGTATFTYTGTNPGEDEIDAHVDSDSSVSDTAEEDWIGPPATLTLTPASGSDSAGDQHTVTATIKDAADQRLKDVKVDFAVSGANTASGDDTTVTNGTATFTYTGTNPGEDAIAAHVDTDTSVSDTAEWDWIGPPAALKLTPSSHADASGGQHTVTATVEDAADQKLSGVKVDFAVSGANTASGDDTTAADGTATFTYTGPNPGQDAIHAHVDTDSSVSDSAGEDWIGPGASLSLAPATHTAASGGQHTITATLEDAAGQKLTGIKVDFAVAGTNTASGADTTASDGTATFTYTGTNPGEDKISAHVDSDSSVAGSAAATWTLAPTITRASATTFGASTPGSFTVTSRAYPTASLHETGALPAGVTFTDNGDGTGTLAGNTTAAGTYPITFTAHNGAGDDATQNFTLTVAAQPLPTITVSPQPTTSAKPPHVTVSHRTVLVTRNRVAITMRCVDATGASCTGVLTLTPSGLSSRTSAAAAKATKVRFTVRAGKSKLLRVAVPKTSRSQLARRHKAIVMGTIGLDGITAKAAKKFALTLVQR